MRLHYLHVINDKTWSSECFTLLFCTSHAHIRQQRLCESLWRRLKLTRAEQHAPQSDVQQKLVSWPSVLHIGQQPATGKARAQVQGGRRPLQFQDRLSFSIHFADHSCADCAAPFPDGEPEARFHGNRRQQLEAGTDVVPRHHHLRPLRQRDCACKTTPLIRSTHVAQFCF